MKILGTVSALVLSISLSTALFSPAVRGDGYPYATGALPPSLGSVQGVVKVTKKVGDKSEDLCTRNESFTVYDVRTQPAPAGTTSGTRFLCETKFANGKLGQVQVDLGLTVLNRRNVLGTNVDLKRFSLKASILDGAASDASAALPAQVELGSTVADVPALLPAPGLTLMLTKTLTGDTAHDAAEISIEAEFDKPAGAAAVTPGATPSPGPSGTPTSPWSSYSTGTSPWGY